MKVLGFNFTKLNAERSPNETKEGIKINTNIDISSIDPVKADFLKDQEKVLGIKFKNLISYEPNYAKVILEGNILISTDEKSYNEILKEWKKKNIPTQFRVNVFNLILRKSSIKALQLEEELHLPLHMPLPSLKASEKEK